MTTGAGRPEPDQTDRPPLGDRFFRPQSMAFIGATPDLTKIRGRLFAFTYRNGYAGDLFPIHPGHDEIGGFRCYPSIQSLGRPVDLAVIAIPAKSVPQTVEDCAAAGVANVLIISSGFAEEGGAASDLQDQLRAIARRTGIRIAGPNSEGFYNAVDPVSATFSPVVEALDASQPLAAADRRVAIVSQSGGMGFAMFTRGRALGLSFSHVISSGNEVDLTASDYLSWMVRDSDTQVIVLLCETIRDGAGFCKAAAEAQAAGKPIVMVKLGRSGAGARAAASHTASLTGSHDAYRAIFRRYGILEAAEMDEAVAMAAALALNPLPQGRRVAVVTASGGGGTTMADVYSAAGLDLPELSEGLQAQILPLIPAHASARNPVDTTAQGHKTGPVSMRCLELIEDSGEVDMFTVIVSAARETSVSLIPEKLKGITSKGRVPLVIWTYTQASNLARRVAAEGGTVLFTDVNHAAKALAGLASLADHHRQGPEPTVAPLGPLPVPASDARAMSEHRVKAWLASLDLPDLQFSSDILVADAAGAAAAASTIGYPVALKIQSPDILHKTELGGVSLGLPDAAAVRAAHAAMMAAVQAGAPDARIEGVLVQKMAPKGIELVVGMVNDATFGPIMMVGAGGTGVELYGDVTHYPAPFGPERALTMLRSLRCAALFHGFRGAPAVDLAPAAQLISTLSRVAEAGRGFIEEMEFNPVILHSGGLGVSVADAVVILKETH